MTGNLTAADHFRAVASGYCERADRTAKLVLRGVYRQLAVEYMALAMQQEAIDRLEALIVRLDADEITAGDHAFGKWRKARAELRRIAHRASPVSQRHN